MASFIKSQVGTGSMKPPARIPLSAIGMLVLTSLMSLLWSHSSMLQGDECYQMWTDRVQTVGQLIWVQRTVPIALDPLAYHLLAHGCILVFGANTFALRLPALLSILLMQICVFIFVRRIAPDRAAIFAMGFPILTSVMGYSLEGRPYALILGLFALAMICWQAAARRDSGRALILSALTATLAIALNTHYFSGILLFGPLCTAELFRSVKRKRLDFPMIAAFVAGAAGIVTALPFMKAARGFRESYGVQASLLSPKNIVWSYIWTIANHPGTKLNRAMFAGVALLMFICLSAYLLRLRRRAILSYEPEEILLIALAALPFFGYPLSLITSVALEPRYVVSLVIGLAGLTALGLFSIREANRYGRFVLATMFIAIASISAVHIQWEREATREAMKAMNLQPDIKNALMASPTQTLYVQDMQCFASLMYYESDPEVLSRIALVYSRQQEEKWNQESVIALTAVHLYDFTHVNIASYESLVSQPGEHVFIDFTDASIRQGRPRGWNWTRMAFNADHAHVRSLGSACRSNTDVIGDVLSVHFLPQTKTQ